MKNKIPVFFTSDVYVHVIGSETSHPDENNGMTHNEWVIIVVQGQGKDPERPRHERHRVVVAWHPTRASARVHARKIAKSLKCPVRETSWLKDKL